MALCSPPTRNNPGSLRSNGRHALHKKLGNPEISLLKKKTAPLFIEIEKKIQNKPYPKIKWSRFFLLRILSELVFVIIYSYFRFELSRISGLMNSGNFFQIIKQRSFLETYYNCDSDSKLLSKIASSCQIESSYWKKFTRVSTVKFSRFNSLKVRIRKNWPNLTSQNEDFFFCE